MEGKELSITLREMACSQPTPLCREWTDKWMDDSDIDTLLDKFVRGQDFCIKNGYPPLDFCRRNFSPEDLHRHHIYLDEEVDILDAESGVWIFLGECTGRVYFNGFSVGTVYVRHSSNICVHVRDMAKAFVSVYESGDTLCIGDRGTTVRLYDRRKR